MCEALGLTRFSTVDMNHGCRCSGAVIDHRDGWRIVYSGDTRPTAQLAAAGAGATLLIHEATFGDDQLAYAQAKLHSTVGEALDIARQYVA
jgi:ribonuclease Z